MERAPQRLRLDAAGADIRVESRVRDGVPHNNLVSSPHNTRSLCGPLERLRHARQYVCVRISSGLSCLTVGERPQPSSMTSTLLHPPPPRSAPTRPAPVSSIASDHLAVLLHHGDAPGGDGEAGAVGI